MAPSILNISPPDEMEGLSRGVAVQFDAYDPVVGIDISKTEFSVGGVIVWQGDAPQPGYSGSRTAISDGWRYKINKTSGWEAGTYYGVEIHIEDTLGGVAEESSWFITAYQPVAGRIWLRTITRRVIRVTFNRDVIVEDALDATKYTIALFNSTGQEVELLGIQGNDPDGNGETQYIDLRLTRPTLGADYKITIANIRTADGKVIESVEGYIRGRLTKTDSILDKLSKVYNVDLDDSVLAHVLAGVGISDDIIGAGENDYDAVAVAESGVTSSTFGTATFGTNTFGG